MAGGKRDGPDLAGARVSKWVLNVIIPRSVWDHVRAHVLAVLFQLHSKLTYPMKCKIFLFYPLLF